MSVKLIITKSKNNLWNIDTGDSFGDELNDEELLGAISAYVFLKNSDVRYTKPKFLLKCHYKTVKENLDSFNIQE